jgi:hypothetical protein
MGTVLVQRPCWFCTYKEVAVLHGQPDCKYCKGTGYVEHWLSQEVGDLLLRVDPEWYKVIGHREDGSAGRLEINRETSSPK